MKTISVVLVTLALTVSAHGGIVGWFTAETRDWQFVQKTGGIHISAPIERNEKKVLPVDYWPEGNSGLAVRKIELKQKGARLVIQVVTETVEKGSDTSRRHFVDLSAVPAGSFEVYYETAGDPAKLLGRIEIK
jgi:hypothetical protein